MKSTAFFTVADNNNMPYALTMGKTLNKFHPEIPIYIYGEKEIKETSIPIPDFFYLATPYIARVLLEKHDCVIKIDADSLVLGNLDHILQDETFEIGTVLNWNRVDPKVYGEIGLATITPQEYYNNGFVVLRNKDFVNEWFKLCTTKHHARMPFREQGFLNILCHYGKFNVRCLDYSNCWHGLCSKGEWNKCIIRNNEVILPKGEDHYPEEDKIIKIVHWGGGNAEKKLNYRVFFNEECIEYINKLVI